MRIDAHQHFWTYTHAEYAWIDASKSAIRRNFMPCDLAPVLANHRLDGCITVQARQSLAETSWLLELADQHEMIKGVVGWVPLADAQVGAILDSFGPYPRLKGVRHVVQAEPAGFLESADFNAGLREVTSRGLAYDLLITAGQLKEAIAFVDRHPQQRFILDHIAKPVVAGPPPESWRRQICELARRPNTACKFSGVVTEVVPGVAWTDELLRPYFETVVEAFGPQRLMFGSDWPVCLVAANYADWFKFVETCIASLTISERIAIMGGAAARAYGL